MKVFWLKKPAEEDMPMFRGAKEPQNIFKINIAEDYPFRYLSITNPNNSSCICTLNNLYFKSKDNNIVKLFMADSFDPGINFKQIEQLQIGHDKNNLYKLKPIELLSVETVSDTNINLLSDNYVLLTPGGSLLIETKLSINEAELELNLAVEKF
ncbi:hypothetical protein [Clostridium caldaquaticum]|uniref:hypothetical protein n=1 Tax=Clostridium caldaquaticum TaxID=2940653 RepID=UPI00207749D5|nr:hypothetical protein [Clostridium caldaquaticum]